MLNSMTLWVHEQGLVGKRNGVPKVSGFLHEVEVLCSLPQHQGPKESKELTIWGHTPHTHT